MYVGTWRHGRRTVSHWSHALRSMVVGRFGRETLERDHPARRAVPGTRLHSVRDQTYCRMPPNSRLLGDFRRFSAVTSAAARKDPFALPAPRHRRAQTTCWSAVGSGTARPGACSGVKSALAGIHHIDGTFGRTHDRSTIAPRPARHGRGAAHRECGQRCVLGKGRWTASAARVDARRTSRRRPRARRECSRTGQDHSGPRRRRIHPGRISPNPMHARFTAE